MLTKLLLIAGILIGVILFLFLFAALFISGEYSEAEEEFAKRLLSQEE
ncbi:hypothetical protein J7L13_01380 [bacterium]|nr:hypothetical protein [bacterium]